MELEVPTIETHVLLNINMLRTITIVMVYRYSVFSICIVDKRSMRKSLSNMLLLYEIYVEIFLGLFVSLTSEVLR